MGSKGTTRICLWSGPRNISTALMYSFAQRKDTLVYDEPLYGYYLSHTKARMYHPGADDIIASMEKDGDKVIDMMMGRHPKPVVFFKHMTHHLLDLDRSFMGDVTNIILTRDPAEMLPSFAQVIATPTMQDVGYALHSDLVAYFDAHRISYVVLDAKRLLLDPPRVLRQLCEQVNIPFDGNMLRWKLGARPEDGVWAKYWYGNVHRSEGFMEYRAKTEPFPEKLIPLLESCLPHYKSLLERAI